jgi:hypothetical protein
VKVLQNQGRIKNCRDHEEDEGRINTDMLHRFVIVGGPLVQAGDSMQNQLQQNVTVTLLFWLNYLILLYPVAYSQKPLKAS